MSYHLIYSLVSFTLHCLNNKGSTAFVSALMLSYAIAVFVLQDSLAKRVNMRAMTMLGRAEEKVSYST